MTTTSSTTSTPYSSHVACIDLRAVAGSLTGWQPGRKPHWQCCYSMVTIVWNKRCWHSSDITPCCGQEQHYAMSQTSLCNVRNIVTQRQERRYATQECNYAKLRAGAARYKHQ